MSLPGFRNLLIMYTDFVHARTYENKVLFSSIRPDELRKKCFAKY